MSERGPMRLYTFFREGMFYPIELPDTDDIAAHVQCNPGTLRVEDALTGEVIWPRKCDA